MQLDQPHGRPRQDRVHPPLTGSHYGGSSGHDDDAWAGGWEVELLQQLPGCNWLEIWQLLQSWGEHHFSAVSAVFTAGSAFFAAWPASPEATDGEQGLHGYEHLLLLPWS